MGDENAATLDGVPAVVGMTKKLTLNLGNYESATVSVHLSMPCEPKKDSINKMYEKVSKWVDSRIDAERQAIRKVSS